MYELRCSDRHKTPIGITANRGNGNFPQFTVVSSMPVQSDQLNYRRTFANSLRGEFSALVILLVSVKFLHLLFLANLKQLHRLQAVPCGGRKPTEEALAFRALPLVFSRAICRSFSGNLVAVVTLEVSLDIGKFSHHRWTGIIGNLPP